MSFKDDETLKDDFKLGLLLLPSEIVLVFKCAILVAHELSINISRDLSKSIPLLVVIDKASPKDCQ